MALELPAEGKASEFGGLVSGAGQAAEEGAGGGLAVGDEDGSALEVAVGADDGAAYPVEGDPAGMVVDRGKVVRGTKEL